MSGLTEGGSGGYVVKPHTDCPRHRPHGVVAPDGQVAACHATKHEAGKHAAAMNAGVPEARQGTVPTPARLLSDHWSADCPACGARMGVRLNEATRCGCGARWRPLVLDSSRGLARLEIVP